MESRIYYKTINTTTKSKEKVKQLEDEGWEILQADSNVIQLKKTEYYNLKAIELVGNNDFFRLKGGKTVYTYKGYCRINKKYEGQAWEDISKYKYVKKGTIVEVDFDY